MNIYFACSITGGREFEPVYRAIVEALTADGHEVPTSHLAGSEVMQMEGEVSPREVYRRDVNWIENCDVLVAEVSVPSHGVGYEIGHALQAKKPVYCLHHRDKKVSKMITGNPNPSLKVESFSSLEETVLKVRSFLDNLP